MTYLANAATVWFPPSGVIPTAVLFDLVPAGAGWMLIVGLLTAVCAVLSMVTNPGGVFGRRRRLRLVRGAAKGHPQPQHA
jgi:hypothetical protein